jgi:hypothetical protein
MKPRATRTPHIPSTISRGRDHESLPVVGIPGLVIVGVGSAGITVGTEIVGATATVVDVGRGSMVAGVETAVPEGAGGEASAEGDA